MSRRAENLEDVLNGRQIGAPRLGLAVKADAGAKRGKARPLPDIRETERPRGYVGERRRPNRD